jgi:hypothetical protein
MRGVVLLRIRLLQRRKKSIGRSVDTEVVEEVDANTP